jgi:hypothetical protein
VKYRVHDESKAQAEAASSASYTNTGVPAALMSEFAGPRESGAALPTIVQMVTEDGSVKIDLARDVLDCESALV